MHSDFASSSLAVHVPLYAIRHTQIGGTEFGIYNLVKGLAAAGANVAVSYGRDSDLSAEFLAWLGQHAEVRKWRGGGLPGPKSVRFFEELLFSLRRTEDDWLVFPNYFCPPRLRSASRRSCVILHDIQYKVYPQYHTAKRRAWLDSYLPRMFKYADQVVLVSNSEAQLVRKHFGDWAADKCVVIPNAIDWSRFGAVDAPIPQAVSARLSHRYILSVCHLFPHKNVDTLVRAFTLVAATDPELRLYLVGSASPRNLAFIRSLVPDSIIDRVEVLGFVDDVTLGVYYQHASLFAVPSLYEGFGVPAVEAMGLGIRTLVSRSFALPEVTLGQARYVDDPLDPVEWSVRMRETLASPPNPDPNLVDLIRRTYSPKAIGHTLLHVFSTHEK